MMPVRRDGKVASSGCAQVLGEFFIMLRVDREDIRQKSSSRPENNLDLMNFLRRLSIKKKTSEDRFCRRP